MLTLGQFPLLEVPKRDKKKALQRTKTIPKPARLFQPPPVQLQHSPISISMKAASSGRALGITPGSLKLVRRSVAMAKRKRTAANTGMAGESWTARYRHLQGNRKHLPRLNCTPGFSARVTMSAMCVCNKT